MTCLVSNASSIVFNGTWTVTMNGNTQSSNEGNVTIESDAAGLDNINFIIHPFGIGSVSLFSVPSATVNGITVYSAERDVYFGGAMKHAIVLARYYDGMMIAEISIPAEGITARFDNVYDHFQLPNSNMEAWNDDINEPLHWHSFMTAYGGYASTSQGLAKLEKSEDVHPGSTGSFSAVMTSKKFLFVVANGTMTNGRLKAGSMTATSTDNHAEMDVNSTETDPNGDLFYMPLYAKPDMFNVWLKFTTSSTSNRANVSVKTFDGSYYQEPSDVTYSNVSGSIVGGTDVAPCDWTSFSFPFDYDSYAGNNAATEAIFVDFATNTTPGNGNDGDKLFVDDIKLVYLAQMTDLSYQGLTLQGWNPAVTEYTLEMDGEPSLDDFTADVTGASAVVTKSMEQTENGYRIAISAVSGDLQTATAYIINVSAPVGMKGDVDNSGTINIADVTALIDYLLSGGDINVMNADVDGSGSINIADVTGLIDYLLTGNFPAN